MDANDFASTFPSQIPTTKHAMERKGRGNMKMKAPFSPNLISACVKVYENLVPTKYLQLPNLLS